MRNLTNNQALTLSAVASASAYLAYRNNLLNGKTALYIAIAITGLGLTAAIADDAVTSGARRALQFASVSPLLLILL